uniref:Uncharacterized protein n=1 Tax=Oryza sativa subsp. japonica TaxID=39947 RepID=Q6ZF22_ORYSJ|nr:hypothetical protein [Oryza sativa Japonica Group]BAD31632.1 hypothetical protein [Oryza sativa Japonica Group]
MRAPHGGNPRRAVHGGPGPRTGKKRRTTWRTRSTDVAHTRRPRGGHAAAEPTAPIYPWVDRAAARDGDRWRPTGGGERRRRGDVGGEAAAMPLRGG